MLALWQAEWIKSQLKEINPDFEIELNKIKTTGDKILDVPLSQVGGKGLFVKEIEEVFEDRIISFLQFSSRSEKICSFNASFSVAASTTKSVLTISSSEVEPSILPKIVS